MTEADLIYGLESLGSGAILMGGAVVIGWLIFVNPGFIAILG